jgi:hypothetical protein
MGQRVVQAPRLAAAAAAEQGSDCLENAHLEEPNMVCSECGVCERCDACSQLEYVFECKREVAYGATVLPKRQRLTQGKLWREQVAALELLVMDFGHRFGDVPGAYMANLAELQLFGIL